MDVLPMNPSKLLRRLIETETESEFERELKVEGRWDLKSWHFNNGICTVLSGCGTTLTYPHLRINNTSI